MGVKFIDLARMLLGVSLLLLLLWIGTTFVTACSGSGFVVDPYLSWEDRDDDGDGYRNGVDQYPTDPHYH